MELTVNLLIKRISGTQEMTVTVPGEASVLDALEAAYRQDTSLVFRHSCHHASCGSCGMIINSQERLACITPINMVVGSNFVVHLEPLHNFPVIADLAVDSSSFLSKMEMINCPLIRKDESRITFHALLSRETKPFARFENCIECGLCVSACPIMATRPDHFGPAVLAAAGRLLQEPRGRSISQTLAAVKNPHGIWRCHSVFLCSDVCPVDVRPAEAIVELRRQLIFVPKGEVKDEFTL
jgi:succinate dehydrogenase / fumarate reductase iron-sulfur subunit